MNTMNKKVNEILNVVETICVLIVVSCMTFAIVLHYAENFSFLPFCMGGLQILGVLSTVIVVSIELFLFYLEVRKFRFFTVGYYVLELVTTMFVNSKFPFSGLVVLTSFSILKNVFRILQVEKIYQLRAFYEVCKKFGIKVKRPVVRRRKAVSAVSVSEKNSKKTTRTKKEKSLDTKTSKSYA